MKANASPRGSVNAIGVLSRRRAIAGFGASGALLAACAGGGSGSSGGSQSAPTPDVTKQAATLTVLNRTPWPQEFLNLGTAFTAEYPALKVELTATGGGSWGEFTEKLLTLVVGGTPPDVARTAVEGLQGIAHKGIFLPLDALLKRDANTSPMKDFIADVHPTVMKSLAYQGKQQALPGNINLPMIHYNTELFNRAGITRPRDDWSIDDFERIARQLTRPENETWGFSTPNALWGGISPWLFIAGTDFLTDDWKQSKANDPRTVEAVERYQSYSTRLSVAPPNADAGNDAWNAGKLAMRLAGASAREGYVRGGMTSFDVLTVPKWRTQDHCFGGAGFGIFKESKHHEATWHFLKHLSREENVSTFAFGSIPARKSVAYRVMAGPGAPPEHHRLYVDVLERGVRSVPSPPEYDLLEAAVRKHLQPVMANQTAAKPAMDELHRELSELLARRPPAVS
ncbi:MAG: hypothetical protein AVDCRST_MAG77-3159 [uncultured Chloroflexi bacterium]|uniref:ABC transporter, substrate-binding protein (Cluster 1, maltose/g3p/polyamine/iron) n=1 Tax=uncultured Chloroflexota bacterium TaxID=166587 RepID=A0A6J4J4E7_9CHLR|nr:MAG: hypothetical protein AVDCRST_MAG77-3159 [uncultured Chloroflexota bacterium]